MENILLTIHLLIAVILVVVILLQRSEGGALGIGGSSGGQFGLFTARGSANFLTRTTAILATLFICSSLLLTVVGSSNNSEEDRLFNELQESLNPTDKSAVEAPAVGTSIDSDTAPSVQDAPAVPVDQ